MFLKQCHRVGVVLCCCLIHFIRHTFWETLAYITYIVFEDFPLGCVPVRGVAEVECVFSINGALCVLWLASNF